MRIGDIVRAMYPRRAIVLGIVVATTGCLRDDLVACSDGRSCPIGTLCDEERATCIDPLGISAPEGVIDFGSVACGGMASVTLPLRNYGVSPIEFDAATTISGVSVSPPAGSIPPGDSAMIEITADPGEQSIPGAAIEGTLVLSTSYEILERPVRLVSAGAVVKAIATVDFGEVQINTDNPRLLVLRNDGNAPADATITALTPPFTATLTEAVRIEPGIPAEVVLHFEPTSIESYAQTAQLSFAGELCQPPPSTIAVSGVATGEPILSSHTVVDFGPSMCGDPASSRTVTFTSNLSSPQTLTPAVSGINASSYSSQGITQLEDAGAASFVVTRTAVDKLTAVGDKSATLAVEVTPHGLTKLVSLVHSIEAPVLTLSTTAIDFGSLSAGEVRTTTVLITNTGNVPATVIAEAPPFQSGARVVVTPNPFQVPAGSSIPLQVQLHSVLPKGREEGTITFKSEGQCSVDPIVTITATVVP